MKKAYALALPLILILSAAITDAHAQTAPAPHPPAMPGSGPVPVTPGSTPGSPVTPTKPKPRAEPTAEQFIDVYHTSWAILTGRYHLDQNIGSEWIRFYQPDPPITNRASFDLAMKSMCGFFHDPYTEYISVADIERMRDEAKRGILRAGLELHRNEFGEYVVHYVGYGSPAYQLKKIRKGDTIIAVGGKLLRNLPPARVEELLKGPKGRSLDLLVNHEGKRLKVFLVLKEDKADDITGGALPGGSKIIYARLPDFMSRDNIEMVLQAYHDGLVACNGKPDAIVLDLRGNPGGIYDLALDLIKRFLNEGVMCTMTSRHGTQVSEHTERVVPEPAAEELLRKEHINKLFRVLRDNTIPMYLLIDGSSASCSEITAGALKDNKRAILVGPERTFGKGVAYEMFDPPVGGKLKVTTGHYKTPDGHDLAIEGGIKPHVYVPAASEANPDIDTALAWVVRDVAQKKSSREPRQLLAAPAPGVEKPWWDNHWLIAAVLCAAIALVYLRVRRRQEPFE